MRVLYSFPTRLGTSGIGMTAWHQVAAPRRARARGHGRLRGANERAAPGRRARDRDAAPAGLEAPLPAARLHARRRASTTAAPRRAPARCRTSSTCSTAGRSAPSAPSRRPARPAFRGLLERPNAHTRFAFDAVSRVPRRARASTSTRRARTPSGPSGSPARSASTRSREALLCPSDFVARTFRDEGFPDDRAAAPSLRLRPGRASAPNGARTRPRPFTVGFVGRGEPRKGLHLALRAWLDSGLADRGRLIVAGAIEPSTASCSSRCSRTRA